MKGIDICRGLLAQESNSEDNTRPEVYELALEYLELVKKFQYLKRQLIRIADFKPQDTKTNPGCGSSEYSQSQYKSVIAAETLKKVWK